jgi:hypothetical protein
MSLGRLLSSGKSLVGLSSASRYQLRTDSLPKFKSQKNPFKPTTEPGDREELTPAEMAAADLKKTQRLPVLPPKPATPNETFQPARPAEIRVNGPIRVPLPHEAKPAIPARALDQGTEVPAFGKSDKSESPAIISNWLRKLNPLVWFGDRKPADAKPAVPRFDKKPVQGELSLENIKVMRNDLTDADVEVVQKKALPMQDIPLPGASAAAMAIPELPPATSAWEYLGERLLRNH